MLLWGTGCGMYEGKMVSYIKYLCNLLFSVIQKEIICKSLIMRQIHTPGFSFNMVCVERLLTIIQYKLYARLHCDLRNIDIKFTTTALKY